MSRSVIRLVTVLVLAIWFAPSVGALGVGLHLVLEHHEAHLGQTEHHHHQDAETADPHDVRHATEISELLEANPYDHRHETSAPEHDHDVAFGSLAPILRPNTSAIATLPVLTCLEPAASKHSLLESSLRRGPPLPLFTANCSLLL